MMSSNREILIVAGEVSGDLHAAPLVDAFREMEPAATFWGTGGHLMRDAGVELLSDVQAMAVMGFSGVVRVLPRLSQLKREILERVRGNHTRLVILVDYPGFNLNLARSLKQLPHPPKILHYIAPQVWAWRAGRAKTMSRWIDHLAVVFPFEVPIFSKYGLPTTFVGHPLIDELETSPPDLWHGRRGVGMLLGLLPGSRHQTMNRHLPIMLEAAQRLRALLPGLVVGIGKAPGLDDGLYRTILEKKGVEFDLSGPIQLWGDTRKLLASATAAAVCSGTATLEAAFLTTPQVVVYHTSLLNYQIIKRLIKLKRVGLVNIVAGKGIAPELIQHNFTSERLSEELIVLLSDTSRRKRMIEQYAQIRERLGCGGAARKVAEIAMELLKE